MKELNDKEIQELLDSGKLDALDQENSDLKLYSRLYEALEEDDVHVPARFASEVSARIYYQQERRASILNRFINSIIALALFAVAFATLKFFDFSLGFDVDTLLNNQVLVMVAGIGFLVLVVNTLETWLKKEPLGL